MKRMALAVSVTAISILTALGAAEVSAQPPRAQARDCSGAAKASVERADLMNRVTVTALNPVDNKNRAAILAILQKRDARQLGISPGQKQQITKDIQVGNPDYKYFVAEARSQYYLAFTLADSCAPFDPIRLN